MPASTIERSDNAREIAELERAFVRKEAWAFEAAYHENKARLFAAALHVLRNREDAEDCVHDVMVRLWRQGHAYRTERGSLGAFLTVCVRNEALSRHRKYANRARIERDHAEPETAIARDEEVAERDRLERALSQLGDKQREAIRLAYVADLPYQEIAMKLNEPVGTIKSRLSGAVRALREQFTLQGELP